MPSLRYLPAALVLMTVAATATKNLAHYPFAILSICGIVATIRHPRDLWCTPGARLLVGLFACIWLPMLLSLPDAVNAARALKTAGLYIHYLPAALYIAHILRDPAIRRIVLAGTALIVAVWVFDGVLQLVSGRDIFGYPYDGSVLKGMFYPKQRFGLVVAVFSPLYIYAVARLARRTPWAWLLLLPLLVVVLYSMKRSAWIMLGAVALGYVACFVPFERRYARRFLLAGVFAALALGGALVAKPNLRMHIAGTLEIFTADFATADRATSHRLSLWRTGANIAADHWVNGVGPRGFRTIYRDYAPADDFWLALGSSGQTHPHWMTLEILVETGIAGLCGYILALALIGRGLWRYRRDDPASAACLLAAFVGWLPLNMHLAFYGSYWSTIVWLLLALGTAATQHARGHDKRSQNYSSPR